MKMTKADWKQFYQPNQKPTIIQIPKMKFITIEGVGDPNEEAFGQAVEALYAIAYAIKMSYKKPNPPKDYYEYTVFPLEGDWDLVDKSISESVKSNYAYKLFIQQPDFVTFELFQMFQSEAMKKKSNPKIAAVTWEELTQGLCCQILHLGSYDSEPQSFDLMEQAIQEQGFHRISKMHREIYLSDPRRVEEAKRKTILRIAIAPNKES